MCVSLARLRHDFTDPDIGEEIYFKIDDAMPVGQLSPLKTTFCSLDRDAMLESSSVIVRFYHDLATGLAAKHGIRYPERLE